MPLSNDPYISSDAIQERISELAAEIDRAYTDANPYLLTVLNGGKPFADELARQLTIDFDTGTIQATSYHGDQSTGNVEIQLTTEHAVTHRYVVLVEDVIDTGRTATALIEHLQSQDPASIRIITLLDKPSRRVVPFEADWVGFTIEDHFVVGFGMDYNDAYRELDDIRILEP